jgi:signal peptidase I
MLPIYNGFQDVDKQPGDDIYPFRGDILLVKKVPIDSLKVGDVIVFNTSNNKNEPPVVHRIVAIWQYEGEYFFKTNGDNNLLPDKDWITTGNDVIGVVVFRIPHVGWFLLVVQTTVGKIIILGLAILVLFVGDDSEEEKNRGDKNKLVTADNYESASRISRLKTLGTKIIEKKSYTYALLALGLIMIFLGSNLFSSFLYSPSVKIYGYNDVSLTANLIESPSTLSLSHQLTSHGNKTTYFFPVLIEVQSGGIFNNIDRIEIRVNETEGLYRWNTVYNFVGTRVFKGAIIAVMERSYEASVSVAIFSRGFFASSPKLLTFSITLRIL